MIVLLAVLRDAPLHVFRFEVIEYSQTAAFAPGATLLDTAEGNLRGRQQQVVDAYHANLQSLGRSGRGVERSREHVTRQAEGNSVGARDDVIEVAERSERRH